MKNVNNKNDESTKNFFYKLLQVRISSYQTAVNLSSILPKIPVFSDGGCGLANFSQPRRTF